MKILQVVFSWQGGAIRVAFDVARALSYKGHKVTIFATDIWKENKDISEEAVGNVHSLHTFCPTLSKKIKFYFTPEVISLAKHVKFFDILHLHEYRTFQNIIFHYYARKYGIPYVLQAHGSLPRKSTKKRLKWIYDFFFGYRLLMDASKVIALNEIEAEQYRIMGVPEEKIAIIPNFIDLSDYADLPSKGEFKKKFNIPEDKKIILYLGRIHRIKGVDILVEAFENIVRELNNIRLIIVGPDDGYLDQIKFLIETKNMKNIVLITGPLYGKDKLEAYVDADVYVLPSRYETFPLTILEAYSCGKSVIASSVGGLKDLVIVGVTGLLFTPENTIQLARSLFYMLEDDTRAKKMGLKGKQFVKENFTIENIIDRLEVLYKEIALI